MDDREKTKEQLISELVQLRQRVAELEASEKEHRLAEETLRENEKRYRDLFENARDLIYTEDLKGNITDANRAVEEYGLKKEEVIGKNQLNFVPKKYWPRLFLESIKIAQGKPVEGEIEIITPKGIVPAEYRGNPIRRGGKVVGAQTIVRDITERKQAEEALRRRNEELAALNAITTTMLQSALDLNEVLQRTADGVVKGLGCNTGLIFLLDEKEGVFKGAAVSTRANILEKLNAIAGFPLLEITIPARSDFNEAMANLLAGRTTIKRDLHELIKPLLNKRICSAMQGLLDSRSFFTVPLLAKGKTVGGIIASTPQELSQADAVKLMPFANQAAIAIENARLFEAERERSTQLGAVAKVAERIASILNPDELLRETVELITQTFGYYYAAIMLLDREANELVFNVGAGGYAGRTPAGFRQKVKEGMIGWAAHLGKTIWANDVSQNPYYIPAYLAETKSELDVPLKYHDRVIGVLDLQSKDLNAFTQHDVMAMETLAGHVAAAIENARLYEETQRQSERLAQTLAISEVLHRDLGLEQVLDQVAQGAVKLGFRRAVINVCQPEEDLVRAQAMAGLEEPDREGLASATYRWSDFQALMQDRFQVSRSYLIRHGEVDWERDFRGVVVALRREDRGPGYWHPEDMLLVPLWGSRGQPVGLLSVDEPVDDLLPDLNTIQTLEAFANQAAIAIENARLFKEIEQRQMYLEGVLGAAPDAIVTLDAHHRIVEWNPGAERLFGYSQEETIGKNIDHLVTQPDVFEEAAGFTQRVIGGEEIPPTETVRYRKDGSPVDVIVAGSPILVGDELVGVVAVYTDITARKRMEETLRALALLDELTGLYNRRGFVTLGQQQLKTANRVKMKMMLLFADFDGLKQINDAFGHPEGDRALIEVADVLRETFRESDIMARIGGDEFVVLAIETNRFPATVLTTRLQENLEARNARGDRRYKLSLSMGLARYDPERPCSIDELVAQADRAMYEKKRGE